VNNKISVDKRVLQYNGQKTKDKVTYSDLQNITQKTKARVTRIPLKTVLNARAPEKSLYNNVVRDKGTINHTLHTFHHFNFIAKHAFQHSLT
jgi:hypothetical protein